MRKNNGNTKVIMIIFAIVVLAIAGALGYFMYDNMQYNILAGEISKISESKTVDLEIKSKGKYQNLEKAIKEYANEYYSSVNSLKELYSKDELKALLSIENIESDGPNFDKTKAITSDFIAKQNTIKENLQKMVSEDYLNNKADEYLLYDKNRELFISTLDLKSDAEKIVGVIDSYGKYVNSIESVLNFLKDNQANWSVKDKKIMFKKVELLNNYNSLIKSQKEAQTELNNKLSNNQV